MRIELFRVIRLVTVSLLLAGGSTVAAENERGKALYYPCAACHWPNGEGSEALSAPAIAGLAQEYIARQLRDFRDGRRGASLDDLNGRQMSLIAANFTDEADVESVAAYVAAMTPAKRPATPNADVAVGSALYAACVACHGDKGQGDPGLFAPALATLDDWYIARQLKYFRVGLRGGADTSQPAKTMRPFASGLGDRDIEVLARYIGVLGESGR